MCQKTQEYPLLLSFFVFSAVISTITGISPGTTLYASNTTQSWSSPNNTFSLHFIPLHPQQSSSPPTFIAAIVYSGGSPAIWSVGNGAAVDSGGSLRFLSAGNLRLVNGSGSIVWDSGTSNMGVSSAMLHDNGNLVLSNGTASVWSSFDNPTDTIVPSQSFNLGMVLRSGLYSFSLLRSGNLTLKWNNSVPYWEQGLKLNKVNFSSPVLGLQSVGILQLSDPNLTSPVVVAYSNDHNEGNDVFRILKLDGDGNLRVYSTKRGSGNVTVTLVAVANQCDVFGYCGNNAICSYNDSNPICGCPSRNFEMVDPNDSRKGCKRKVSLEDCPGKVAMLQVDHARFLTYPPQFLINPDIFFIPIPSCRGTCLSSSSCFASTALSDGTGLCYIKTGNFISGYQNLALPSTSYIKVCGPVVPNSSPDSLENAREWKHQKIHTWVVAVVVLSTFFGFLALEVGLWFRCCRNRPGFRGFAAEYLLLEYASGAPVHFSYKELHKSTKGFKEKVGDGGFGAVYRGILANQTVVAVKQLEGIEQGEKQFKMEVSTIISTHHLNLVKLIGFCSEGHHRLLVYEFMKNGSLDNFLFVDEQQQSSGKVLSWEYRFNIALGAARGLTYLHDECRNCIVHCDVKPENILLDENYNAKVSDFGLAKLVSPMDHRHRNLTSVRGTRGYLAPECLASLPITSKSDVYSFGMVLLEIVSGRRNFEISEETSGKKSSIWAYEEYEKGNILGVIDRRLVSQVNLEQAKRVLLASFWCIQEQPSQRPTIGKVVQMLEGVKDIDRPPAPKSEIH